MIEGIKVRLESERLRVLLEERVKHHLERHKWYSAQVANLKAGNAEAQQYTNGDPVRSLQESMTRHSTAASRLGFISGNLVANEVYELADDDLIKLELIEGRGYF